MFINIVPPVGSGRGQWMDYRCRLVRKFIHCFGAQQPRGKIGLSYSSGLWDFIFFVPALLLSMLMHLFLSSSLSLSYFIFAVPMRKCLGKHSCMSSSYSTVILNDTTFFRQCNYKCTLCIQSKNWKQLCTSIPIPLN